MFAVSTSLTSNVDISANSAIWNLIEPCCSIIAACLPTLKPLVQAARSPKSLVKRLLSYMSPFSNSVALDNRSWPAGSAARRAETWQQLEAVTSSKPYTAEVELGYPEHAHEAGTVRVDRSFGSEIDRK